MNILTKDFQEYLKYLEQNYEIVTFRLANNALVTRINIRDFFKIDSTIITLLRRYSNKEFIIDDKLLENSVIDLNDDFASDYANMLNDIKKM